MRTLFSFVLLCLLNSCTNYGQLTFVAKLPKKLDESSGIVSWQDSLIWVIEDGGNADKVYKVNFKGELLEAFKITKAKNKDWEDLAKDKEGNLFIGDFGNNDNDRKDLVIYKIKIPENTSEEKIQAEAIEFWYPDQKKFPPKKEKRVFDAEALFYARGHLYIITKNRSHPFSGIASVYRVPAESGKYEAQLMGSFTPCEERHSCSVTAADISPDGKKIALLGYGRLWVFSDFQLDSFTGGKWRSIDLGATSQLESLCFQNDSTLLLADEKSHGTGGNLYSFKLRQP